MNTIRKEKDIVVIQVYSDLIINELSSFEEDMVSILNDNNKNIVIDLAKTVYLTASGIHTLMRMLKKAQERLSTVKFVNMHENVKRNLNVVGLLRFLDVFDNENAAIDSFNENVSNLEKNLLWD